MIDRSVVVTGANGGIGSALCTVFHLDGWQIIATDIAETCEIPCNSYVPLDLDLMCRDSVYAHERLQVLRTELPNGKLNALINNAATQVVAPIEELSTESWRQTLDVNLMAPAILIRELLGGLATGKGAVTNIASIHAYLTKPNFSAYASSKAGLVGLTRALAVELGGRVRVNAICPAAIATPMLVDGFSNRSGLGRLANFHPSRVIGDPEDVARAALFLSGAESAFLTGAILGLDGGIGSRLHDPE